MRFIERPYCERLGTPFARHAPSCAMTTGRRAGWCIG
jgi:hypothetical protein